VNDPAVFIAATAPKAQAIVAVVLSLSIARRLLGAAATTSALELVMVAGETLPVTADRALTMGTPFVADTTAPPIESATKLGKPAVPPPQGIAWPLPLRHKPTPPVTVGPPVAVCGVGHVLCACAGAAKASIEQMISPDRSFILLSLSLLAARGLGYFAGSAAGGAGVRVAAFRSSFRKWCPGLVPVCAPSP